MNEVTQTKQQILCLATHTPNIGIDEELNAISAVMQGRNML